MSKTLELTTNQLAALGLPSDTISVQVHNNGSVDYYTRNRSTDMRATRPWGFTLHDPASRIAVMEVFPLGETRIKWIYA